MISGRDIIYISSIEWNFLWQGHQEIALRLAQAGNRVLYVENTGIRSPGLRDASRVALRLKHWAHSLRTQGVREVAPNVYVCSPLVLPPFGSVWRRQLNRRLLLPLVRNVARRLGMRDPLLWTYLPTDSAVDLIRLTRGAGSVIVYYCVADFAQLTPHVRDLRRSEQTMVEMSDVVFTNCAQLAARCRQWNENVHVFPPGVNLEAFPLDHGAANSARDSAGTDRQDGEETHPALESVPRPVIGYVGGIHRYVDFELLKTLARARPDWSWVFVGPLQADVGELAALPNVMLLGQQPHDALVRYIRAFDVCLVPYVNNPETATVVPVKINEYLAVGKPVVSTALPTVCDFNRQHAVLLTAPNRPEDFLAAIETALRQPRDAAAVAGRRAVAALSDWQARLATMSAIIEQQAREKNGR